MKERVAPGGPFGRVLYYPKKEIDELCEAALDAAGCLPEKPEPVEIETFIEIHFGARVAYDDLGQGILGYTAFNRQGEVSAIGASRDLFDGSNAGARRARSTLAHEAGHGLLHSRLFGGLHEYHPLLQGNYDAITQRTICRERDLEEPSGVTQGSGGSGRRTTPSGGS